jgi:hypothetical protein
MLSTSVLVAIQGATAAMNAITATMESSDARRHSFVAIQVSTPSIGAATTNRGKANAFVIARQAQKAPNAAAAHSDRRCTARVAASPISNRKAAAIISVYIELRP